MINKIMKYSMYKGLMSTLHIFLLWIHICMAQSSSIVVSYLRLVFCVLIYNTRGEKERGIFMNKWIYFFLTLIATWVTWKRIINIWWWLTGNVSIRASGAIYFYKFHSNSFCLKYYSKALTDSIIILDSLCSTKWYNQFMNKGWDSALNLNYSLSDRLVSLHNIAHEIKMAAISSILL